MSRPVPKVDTWSRLNEMNKRLSTLERHPYPTIASAFVPLMTTTSTGWSTPTGAPLVEVTISASADALLTLSSRIATSAAGDFGLAGVSVDGGSPMEMLSAGADSSAVTVPASLQIRLSDLADDVIAAGMHTFQVVVRSSSGDAVAFEFTSLVVEPL